MVSTGPLDARPPPARPPPGPRADAGRRCSRARASRGPTTRAARRTGRTSPRSAPSSRRCEPGRSPISHPGRERGVRGPMTHLLDATTYDPDDEVNLSGYADSMAVYVGQRDSGLVPWGTRHRATWRGGVAEHYSLRDLDPGRDRDAQAHPAAEPGVGDQPAIRAPRSGPSVEPEARDAARSRRTHVRDEPRDGQRPPPHGGRVARPVGPVLLGASEEGTAYGPTGTAVLPSSAEARAVVRRC